MSSSGPSEATAKLEVAKLEERRQKIYNLIIQEKQSHDRRLAGLHANLNDVNAKIVEYQQGWEQQGPINANGGLHQDQLRSPHSYGLAMSNNNNISNGGDSGIVASDAPPGFSGNLHAQESFFYPSDQSNCNMTVIARHPALAQHPVLPQEQQQLQKHTSTAHQLLHLKPITQPMAAPLSPKPIAASVLRMLLPPDNSSWPDTPASSHTSETDWYPRCSITPSVQAVKSTFGSYAQQQAPHLQTDLSPHPNLVSIGPTVHAEDSDHLLRCPLKPQSSALAPDYLPVFGSDCSTDFSCIPNISAISIPDGIHSTNVGDISHFQDTPTTAPPLDPTLSYLHSKPSPPLSAYPLSFGDFPVMAQPPLYSAQPQFAYMQGQNGNMSASQQHQSSPAISESRSVFDRLQLTPVQQQQVSSSTPQQHKSQTPTHPSIAQAPQGPHDLPPGFASPEGLPAGAGEFPPGFKSPKSSSASHSAPRSRMRSDQMAPPAQPEQNISQSAHSAQAAPGQGGLPGGPPGFGGLPAYLAQRLSPSPAQKPAELPDQAGPHRPRIILSSPEYGNSRKAGQNSRQHLPAGAYDALSDDSSDEEPPGFASANNTAAQLSQAPVAKFNGPEHGRQPPRQLQKEGPPGYSSGTAPNVNNQDSQEAGQDEFPGLAFGIKDLDQRQKFSSADSSQDFPSLGSAAGNAGGPKPAGVWGKGAGRLAGSLQQQQQQQQISNVASSLAAAVQSPQPPTVHIERVELSANLRVAGDDASDSIRRKRAKRKEFEQWQRIKGMGMVNLVEGLELYENVLSPDEQTNMIHIIEDWVIQGKQGKLRGRTFSAPRKWARGKGRITCQFGCCYNYAVDSEGRKPGIVAEEVVEKMPPVLVSLCKRLVRWAILPKHKEPDTAIINVYDVDDCIPPHIDHHDFDRPFCTISLLSQQNIMFGNRIISRGPGDFVADYEMPLPTGSCLVLKGNGADVAQHCVPPVTARRMSITLRRMQDVHARRVVGMAERIHAGLPVDTDNPPSGPQRLTADDAYDMDERKEAASGYGARRRNG